MSIRTEIDASYIVEKFSLIYCCKNVFDSWVGGRTVETPLRPRSISIGYPCMIVDIFTKVYGLKLPTVPGYDEMRDTPISPISNLVVAAFV